MSDSGFTAFIDESGDEGFVFRDPPARASSQWFTLSAIVVRNCYKQEEMLALKNCIETVFNGKWTDVHFVKLKHEQRCAITNYLSTRRFRVISICWNKREITEDGQFHTLHEASRLHHYAIRYLMERLSWLSHFSRDINDPNPLSLVFSKCKNLQYNKLKSYLQSLKGIETNIRWGSINVDKFKVRPSSELLGLKAADAVASGISKGLELNRHQLCEDAHCRHLKRITYNHNGRFLNYGLKIMPRIPAVEPECSNRYAWIDLY